MYLILMKYISPYFIHKNNNHFIDMIHQSSNYIMGIFIWHVESDMVEHWKKKFPFFHSKNSIGNI
jgi:hypothetical protein